MWPGLAVKWWRDASFVVETEKRKVMKDEGGNAKWSLSRTLDEAILARHVTGQRSGPPMRCDALWPL